MKKYKVVWEEKAMLIVKAKNSEEAEEKVMQGDFVEEPETIEMTTLPEATEIK